LEFIPNGEFNKIKSLMAKDEEEKVVVINNSSYHTQKDYVSGVECEEHKYPCVYSVMKTETKFKYSKINNKGHFGFSKLIWGRGRIKSVGSFVDLNGEYGLTEFTSAIVDDKNNIEEIKTAFDTFEFRKLMELCSVGNMSINHKVIATFRKDFYKQFLND
jgi:hypothetical protein